jgi:lysozyme
MKYITVKKRRRRHMKKKTALLIIIGTAVFLAVVVLVLALSIGAGGRIGADDLNSIPRNKYDTARFSTSESGRITYDAEHVSYGVDVSELQGEIDWVAVASDGIDFAIIRAGFRGYSLGDLYTDTHFQTNLEGAQAAGLDTGVYFFSQALTVEEAAEEAWYVLELLDGRSVEYPVVFDWERIDYDIARTDEMDYTLLSSCAAEFCRIIADAGYTPAIYFNATQGYVDYDLAVISDFDFWLAEYDSAPGFIYHFDIWQYTDSGTVAGIDGGVDINICFKKY